jgi:RNA polymerase sigma-70 factor (ECF subfamily)
MSYSPDFSSAATCVQTTPPAPPVRDFERTVLPHLEAAQRLARYLLRHEQDAEDCVQEACFRAFRAFGQFRGEDAKGWFLIIVRNTSYQLLRRRRRSCVPVPFDELLHSDNEMPGAGGSASSDILARGLLPVALDRLPAKARAILVLRDIDGLAYKEICARTRIPMGTVMSRLSRARLRLQSEFRDLMNKTASFDCDETIPPPPRPAQSGMAA